MDGWLDVRVCLCFCGFLVSRTVRLKKNWWTHRNIAHSWNSTRNGHPIYYDVLNQRDCVWFAVPRCCLCSNRNKAQSPQIQRINHLHLPEFATIPRRDRFRSKEIFGKHWQVRFDAVTTFSIEKKFFSFPLQLTAFSSPLRIGDSLVYFLFVPFIDLENNFSILNEKNKATVNSISVQKRHGRK